MANKTNIRKFDADTPARDIQELTRFLEDQHRDTFFYRGQTKCYRANAPSAYRSMALLDGAKADWVELDKDAWRRAADRDRARSDLKQAILNSLGLALGNIICQQYGVSSDGYDITSSLKIASFFATRKFPSYEHFPGSSSNPVGVIYRFRFQNQHIQEEVELENSRKSLYHLEPGGKRIWFDKVIPFRNWLVRLGTKSPETDIQKLVEKEGMGQVGRADLLRPSNFVGQNTFKWIYAARAIKMNFDGHPMIQYYSSRSARQKGGMLFPIYKHDCIVPATQFASRTSGRDVYLSNGKAISMGATHIAELNRTPNSERFFFNHSLIEPAAYSPEHLWPSRDEDHIYGIIYHLAEVICEKYLSDYNALPDDLERGVIDPGYLRP